MTFPEGTAGWVRRALSFLGIFLGATLLLYVTDIGCIIRTVTGVPCPGCGMTRAWLAFLKDSLLKDLLFIRLGIL